MTEALRKCKELFLRFQLLFPDFYHFHHIIWGMKWAKKLKTKNGQNMSSGSFSHDAAHLVVQVYELITCVRRANENAGNLISVVQFLIYIYIYL